MSNAAKIGKELEDDKALDKDDDDFFAKFLEEDEDDDPDKKDDKDPDKKGEKEDDTLAIAEKERKGMLADVVKSRRAAAEVKKELQELKATVGEILDKRQNALKKGDEGDKDDKVSLEELKLPVEFEGEGEDAKAYVSASALKAIFEQEGERTEGKLKELTEAQLEQQAKSRFDSEVQSVLDQNPDKYNSAYNTLKAAVKDLNNAVIEIQEQKGIPEGVSIPQALDLLDGSEEEKEFLNKYPEFNVERIARAFESKRDLKFALDQISNTKDGGGKFKLEEEDALLEKARTKPSSLTKGSNQSSDTDNDLLGRISKLSYEDFEEMSDADAKRLERMMLKEELRGD